MTDRYNFSLTTFSPSGKLVQIEYALNAVAQGVTSIGIKASNGAVIVTEKKSPTLLVDETTLEKVSMICATIGMVYSGMGPDARVLLAKARNSAQIYKRNYGEYPPVLMLVKEIASVIQEYTQSGGVRPFGVSLLVIGVDKKGPSLYQVDPSGAFWAWKASAIGKNMVNVKSFLERRYPLASTRISDETTAESDPPLDLEDAVHMAILALKDGFEGNMNKDNIEIGLISTKTGQFQVLAPSEIADYLTNI